VAKEPQKDTHRRHLANTNERSVVGRDAGCCYRYWSNSLLLLGRVALYSVVLSVCLSVSWYLAVNSEKTAESIMPFGVMSGLGPGNRVFDGRAPWHYLTNTTNDCAQQWL